MRHGRRWIAWALCGVTLAGVGVQTGALVAAGSIVYFGIAWVIGGMDKEDVLALVRRKKVAE